MTQRYVSAPLLALAMAACSNTPVAPPATGHLNAPEVAAALSRFADWKQYVDPSADDKAFTDGNVHRPRSTFGNVNADVLEHFDDTFVRDDFVQIILDNSWPE